MGQIPDSRSGASVWSISRLENWDLFRISSFGFRAFRHPEHPVYPVLGRFQ